MTHHAHLLEERLFECYLAEQSGEAIDPRLAEHLADCESCAARYADLAAFMEALQDEGAAEADAVFSAERLQAQHQQIARRLELVGQRAKVLSFPRRFVRSTMTPASSHAAPRWMAAAAAAGLFVGVAVGASYNYGSHSMLTSQIASARLTSASRQSAANRAIAPDPSNPANRMNPANLMNPMNPANPMNPVAVGSGGSDSAATVPADDAFLSDLESALERPHTRELLAFDAFTPHARDVALRR